MGKGGFFFFDFMDMGVNAMRGVMGCLCCLLCVGPIFLLVGIILLVAPNDRQEKVDKYNDAIKAYAPTIGYMKETSGYVESSYYRSTILSDMAPFSQVVPHKDDNGGVDDATSEFQQSNRTVDLRLPRLARFTIAKGNGTYSKHMDVWRATFGSDSERLGCTNSKGCSTSTMEKRCQDISGCGGSAVWTSTYSSKSKCSSKTNCGTCSYSYYTPEVCMQMTLDNKTWIWTQTNLTCDYPFNKQRRVCTSGGSKSAMTDDVRVQFRSSNDPYVILSGLTDGKMEFGMTEAQQRALGLALMAIGIVFIVCLCAGMAMAKNMFTNKDQRGRVKQAMPWGGGAQQQQQQNDYQQMPAQMQAPPPQQQQPYAQPQPGYQQPPPAGYAQPQPGYGQPPPPQPGYAPGPTPGYGQPPPQQAAYNQPQQQYGQQPLL